jgi:hypothetical protein
MWQSFKSFCFDLDSRYLSRGPVFMAGMQRDFVMYSIGLATGFSGNN